MAPALPATAGAAATAAAPSYFLQPSIINNADPSVLQGAASYTPRTYLPTILAALFKFKKNIKYIRYT